MPLTVKAPMPEISVGVVIVTYQSENTLQQTLDHLKNQSRLADHVLIIDSASPEPEYLATLALPPNTHLISLKENLGFSVANNIGFEKLRKECDFLLFLNPDAFLTPTFLEAALEWMETPHYRRCAALTGLLLGYDPVNGPNGRYDSTGVFSRWYGNWYDRDQGQLASKKSYCLPEKIPAICGALMFCRTSALLQLSEKEGYLFDSSFFMYKEDIDLSLRLRKAGWFLMLVPTLSAYHCRGWKHNRSKIPKHLRICSAYNELKIHWRLKKPIPIFYSLFKLFYVQTLNR